MSNALQEKAVERIESFIPTASIQVDPERPSTYSLHLFQVWDREGRVRARFTTNAEGEFVGGTILFGRDQLPYGGLTEFLAGLSLAGDW